MSLLVEFTSDATEETIDAIHRSLGVEKVLTTENLNRGTRIDEVRSPYAAAIDDIARAYRANAYVLFVQRSQHYAAPADRDDGGRARPPEDPGAAPVIDLPTTD